MSTSKDIVLGILDIVILEKYDDKYINYVIKTIDYNIEYVEPIDIIIIPRKIYVSTKRIREELPLKEFRKVVVKFCTDLVIGINDRYIRKDIKPTKYTSMGSSISKKVSYIDSVKYMLIPDDVSANINIDIPPNLNVEIIINDFDPIIDLNKECICVILNN